MNTILAFEVFGSWKRQLRSWSSFQVMEWQHDEKKRKAIGDVPPLKPKKDEREALGIPKKEPRDALFFL